MANTSEIANKYLWFINGKQLGIVEKNIESLAGEEFISVSTAGLKIRLEYVSRPLPFTSDLTTRSEIPDQFHECLCYKVIADLYKLPGDSLNLQLAQYFDQQYLSEVREGKKYASRHKVSGGFIKPVEF